MLRRTSAIALVISLAGCSQDPEPTRYTRAVAPPMHHLDAAYPASVRVQSGVLSRALIARGDSLFHGIRPPGNCTICHGVFLTAGTGGTNLRDGEWHHGDGTFESIVETIIDGVQSTDHLTMPPRGGMPLSDAEVRAVAAYVYWKSRTPAPVPVGDRAPARPLP